MKIPQDMTVGTIHDSKKCGKFKIKDYISTTKIVIEFIKTGSSLIVTSGQIRTGSVKDRMVASVSGVGFIGIGCHKPNKDKAHTREYIAWLNMIKRCCEGRYKSYIGCSVCDEWHNFQNFADWYIENSNDDIETPSLDKDLKIKGNKVYSPSTCAIVSKSENSSDAMASNFSFISPAGDVESIYNLADFCRKNDLERSAMSRVHGGFVESYKGWRKAP